MVSKQVDGEKRQVWIRLCRDGETVQAFPLLGAGTNPRERIFRPPLGVFFFRHTETDDDLGVVHVDEGAGHRFGFKDVGDSSGPQPFVEREGRRGRYRPRPR